MRTCPSNSKKVQYCLSDGSGWATTCSCENEGNGTVYCQGMRLTTSQSNTCMHGIWSSETCSGICCCTKDMPKLMSNGYPGCWGSRTNNKGFTTSSWQYACICQRPSSGVFNFNTHKLKEESLSCQRFGNRHGPPWFKAVLFGSYPAFQSEKRRSRGAGYRAYYQPWQWGINRA